MTKQEFIDKVAYCYSKTRERYKLIPNPKEDQWWANMWYKCFTHSKVDNIQNKDSKVFYEWFKEII